MNSDDPKEEPHKGKRKHCNRDQLTIHLYLVNDVKKCHRTFCCNSVFLLRESTIHFIIVLLHSHINSFSILLNGSKSLTMMLMVVMVRLLRLLLRILLGMLLEMLLGMLWLQWLLLLIPAKFTGLKTGAYCRNRKRPHWLIYGVGGCVHIHHTIIIDGHPYQRQRSWGISWRRIRGRLKWGGYHLLEERVQLLQGESIV